MTTAAPRTIAAGAVKRLSSKVLRKQEFHVDPFFEATLRFWEKAIIEGTIATAEIAQMSPAIRTYPIRNEHQQAGTSLASSYNANTQRFERMADALYDLRAAVELAIPAFEEVLKARAKL